MKFVIITDNGQYTTDAEDMEAALESAWNNHTGYDDIQAIVRVDED